MPSSPSGPREGAQGTRAKTSTRGEKMTVRSSPSGKDRGDSPPRMTTQAAAARRPPGDRRHEPHGHRAAHDREPDVRRRGRVRRVGGRRRREHLVGAPFDDTAGPDTGAAYLFDGATGALLQTFLVPGAVPNAQCARAVAALGGDALVICHGAYLFDAGTALVRQRLRHACASHGSRAAGGRQLWRLPVLAVRIGAPVLRRPCRNAVRDRAGEAHGGRRRARHDRDHRPGSPPRGTRFGRPDMARSGTRTGRCGGSPGGPERRTSSRVSGSSAASNDRSGCAGDR
jgi:hypothetical protein